MSRITVTVESSIPESALRQFLEETLQTGLGYEVEPRRGYALDFELDAVHFHRDTIHDSRTGRFSSLVDEQADPDHTVRES